MSEERADVVDGLRRRVAELETALAEANQALEQAERQAAEALWVSEARLRQIIDLVPHLIFAKNREGRFLLVNEAMARLYGSSVEAMTGRLETEFAIGDAAVDHFRRNDLAVIDTQQPRFIPEETLIDAQGRPHVLQTMKIPFSLALSGEPAVLGVAVDITELKQAETELRTAHAELDLRVQQRTAELAGALEGLKQERNLLHTLMDNLPHNIYFKDTASRFIRVNAAMARYIGLADAAAALGKTDFDFFTGEHAHQAAEDEQTILRTGEPLLDKEEKETWPDGHVTWVSTTKMPLCDDAGQIVGTFGISRDVTEKKLAAEALQAAKEAAEQANLAKSTFLANMSHEIRTPLNAIIGMTDLVLKSRLMLQQRDFLTTVKDSGEALLAIINDILDFSKIEAGKVTLERAPFDLWESLGDTLKAFSLRAFQQGLELTCEIRPDVPRAVCGDYNRLRQIVVNLVGNALKFTERGEVAVEVGVESRAADQAVLHFSVRDTGIGIPADKQSQIFEMFEQADSSTTRRYGGTGLGLAIAARLVELMNGRIWVESQVGQGSTFHFTVALAVVDAVAPAERAKPAAPLEGRRVLVVDDNATSRRIVDEIVQNWRMAPSLAASAPEALTLLEEALDADRPFDVVVTDTHMPEMDGFMLIGTIRQHPRLKQTVVVMLTSGDRPEDPVRCRQLGVAAYLLKPVKPSELLDAIQEAFEPRAESPLSPAAAGDAQPVRPLQVLLVEDSLVNQKLAGALLGGQGHNVTIVENGVAALEAIAAHEFDLVLMDLQMPEMDGLEATSRIRAREKETGRHVPVVAMTAHVLKGDRERCLETGMDGYITKPIRADELFATIAAMFGGDRLAPSAPQAADESSTIDWADALAALGNDRRLLTTVVQTALDEIPRLLETIERALAAGDAPLVRRSAHTLHGSIRYFGAREASRLAMELEVAGRDGLLAAAGPILSSLQPEIARVVSALGEYAAAEH